MVEGIPFSQLETTILEQKAKKRDAVVPANEMYFVTHNGKHSLSFNVNDSDVIAELSENALRQLAAWEDIPTKYFNRLLSDTRLLSENINKWLQQSDSRRLLRLIKNDDQQTTVRAFVSDRFSVQRDNSQLANHIFPRVRAAGMHVKSCHISDDRMYLQVIDENLQAWIKQPRGERVLDDQLYGGFVLSNGEVGQAPVTFEPMLYRTVCTNGMIVGTGLGAVRVHKKHLGRILGANVSGSVELTEDDYVSDAEFLNELDKALDSVLSREQFDGIVARINHAIATTLPYELDQIVKVAASILRLSEGEAEQLTIHLMRDGYENLWDLANGVTRTAQDQEYVRAVDLERLGSAVLQFNPTIFADVNQDASKDVDEDAAATTDSTPVEVSENLAVASDEINTGLQDENGGLDSNS